MKRLNIIFILAVITLISSCYRRLDNVGAPDAGIQGKVTDSITGQPILTETPNGIKIRLIEEKYKTNATPLDMWVKEDGIIANTKVFAGAYKIIAMEGAFFPVDTVRVTVSGLTEVNFKVTPFLAIQATITAGAGSATASYKLVRTRIGSKISDAKLIASGVPTVSNAVFDPGKSVSRSFTAVDDATVLATQYSDVLSGLEAGKTYYLRVAARTAGSKYNYSPVVKLTIQ